MKTFLLLITVFLSHAQADEPLIKNGQRILWLGDSVTAKGTHIALVDAYLMTQLPELKVTNMPCGLSSETACGLSEPLHPWPRPNVHERLDRVIEKFEFDVAVVCYGVNDGIYAPFSDERFATFQEGMTLIIEKLKATGATVIALTPAPFDAGSFPAEKLLPTGAEEYGYTKVYEDYNEVMRRYAAWVIRQTVEGKADHAFDITNHLTHRISETRRADPSFKSGDGVHPNDQVYAWLAERFLQQVGFEDALIADVPQAKQELAIKRHRMLATSYLEHAGHKRPGAPKNPMPLAEALEKAATLEARIRE